MVYIHHFLIVSSSIFPLQSTVAPSTAWQQLLHCICNKRRFSTLIITLPSGNVWHLIFFFYFHTYCYLDGLQKHVTGFCLWMYPLTLFFYFTFYIVALSVWWEHCRFLGNVSLLEKLWIIMSVVNLFRNSHEINGLFYMVFTIPVWLRSLRVLYNNRLFSVVGQVKESHILPDTWSKAALYHFSPNSHVWIFMQSRWHSEKMSIIANAFYHAVQKCHRQSSDSSHCSWM